MRTRRPGDVLRDRSTHLAPHVPRGWFHLFGRRRARRAKSESSAAVARMLPSTAARTNDLAIARPLETWIRCPSSLTLVISASSSMSSAFRLTFLGRPLGFPLCPALKRVEIGGDLITDRLFVFDIFHSTAPCVADRDNTGFWRLLMRSSKQRRRDLQRELSVQQTAWLLAAANHSAVTGGRCQPCLTLRLTDMRRRSRIYRDPTARSRKNCLRHITY